MRTAVCLHGLARGSTIQADGAYSEDFATLRESIQDADVFIHSWDVDISDKLMQIFNPVDVLFEPQMEFEEEMEAFKDVEFKYDIRYAKQGSLFKTLSFLYSRKRSVDLKQQYETKHDMKYDCVLVSRFDVGHHKQGENQTSYLHFDRTKDMSVIYQAYWNQLNAGLSDHWFYSNSENIDMIATLYDKCLEYLHPDSHYCSACRKGWPISNRLEQFSNELLKNKSDRSNDLVCLLNAKPSRNFNGTQQNDPAHSSMLNNHCLYKYHLMQHDMLDDGNSVFLNQHLW